MKIFIICSKRFYDRVPEIQETIEAQGHILTLPNSYEDPGAEARYRGQGSEVHAKWKAGMLQLSERIIGENDAVLVLNFEKDGVPNYIGGATFLEMYEASKMGKRVFLYNEIPEGILKDEILSFEPVVLCGNLDILASY